MNVFEKKLPGGTLTRDRIEIVQINVGKLCNQTCVHCHVDAGPSRTEIMTSQTAEETVRFIQKAQAACVDITGGAPELNPSFRYLVEQSRALGCSVIDRCNLTVLFEPGMEGLAEFLAANEVEVIASLPCYSKENVDKQRGKGVFDKSLRALEKLNSLGYGRDGSGLRLNLVYNPVGPYLPPPQDELEADYKERLREDFGIEFNRLYTITNMPVNRFSSYLKSTGQYEAYMELLITSFNLATLDGLMCRNTVSIGWDGQIYDCDFNQMLGMPLDDSRGFLNIAGLEPRNVLSRRIETGAHCFGCTAGSGSSCSGSLS